MHYGVARRVGSFWSGLIVVGSLVGCRLQGEAAKDLEVLTLQVEQGEEVFLEEDEEEPVFVLTDEWAEFFAKSEAKRRLGNHLVSDSLSAFLFPLTCSSLSCSTAKQQKKNKGRKK